MSVMGVLSVVATLGINPNDVDYDRARGRADSAEITFSDVLKNKAILLVAVTLFLFHLGNAALLPLLGQSAVARFGANPASYTAATVVLAQGTMIVMALVAAKVAQKRGYAILFFAALIALTVRGAIAGFWDSPWSIIPVQALDGVGAGFLGVATPGIIAELLKGSGHTNMGLGFVLTVQGLGASLSNSFGGYFAHYFGYSSAFIALAGAAFIGLVVFSAASSKWLSECRKEKN